MANRMLYNLTNTINKHPFALALIYSILLRLFLFIFYNSVTIFPDTEDYTSLALYLQNFSLENYTGERTPGLPFLIALLGGNLKLTVLIQTIIGLLNVYLVFDFCKTKTGKINFAFWIAIITTSFLHVVFYELAILTETLTLFFLFLSFWYIQKFDILKPNTSIKHYFILSIILSYLYFIRPMFIYVPIGFSIFYLARNFNFEIKKIIPRILAILLLPLLCFYSWCSLNEKNIGQFTSSYYLGINLAQVVTPFFEKAPEEDKLIRDIFVKHRIYVEQNLPRTEYPMTAWYALEELIEKTGLTRHELMEELGRISKNLIKSHPDLYAKQVFVSWNNFWFTSSILWNAEKFQNKYIKTVFVGIWNYIQSYLLILINLLFVIFSFKKLFQFFKSKCSVYDLDLLIVAIVLSGSLAQALVVFDSSNSRFSFPFFPLIVYFVLVNVMTLKNNYAKRTLP